MLSEKSFSADVTTVGTVFFGRRDYGADLSKFPMQGYE
jgi:hypothetical protein